MFGKIFRSLWLAIAWSAIIFILLSIPGKDLPEGPKVPSLDKIIHIFLFGVQAFLWCRALRYRNPAIPVLQVVVWVIILSSAYGIAMEYYQHYFVANRSFELGDILADITGALLGGLTGYRKRAVT